MAGAGSVASAVLRTSPTTPITVHSRPVEVSRTTRPIGSSSPQNLRAVRWLTAWTYALRSLAALALPGHDARRYWRHVTATLRPERGAGLREAAEAHNRALRR